MHIAVAAAPAKKYSLKIKQLRVVAPDPVHTALKKACSDDKKSCDTKKILAVELAAVTSTARQIRIATKKILRRKRSSYLSRDAYNLYAEDVLLPS